MNLNVKTLEILKNFYSINPSLVVKEGNVLTTISTAKTIVAKATVPDTFTKRFAMYNLGHLISSVTEFEKAEITFEDTVLYVNEAGKTDKVRLAYADESGIKVPPEKAINLPTVDAVCKVTTDNLRTVQRKLGSLDLPEIAITGDGVNISLQAIDSKNASSNMFSVVIGTTDKNFRAIFKPENIKIIPGDYEVSICSKGISHFVGSDIEYWIAVESNSTYS
jgi:hypothetical protein